MRDLVDEVSEEGRGDGWCGYDGHRPCGHAAAEGGADGGEPGGDPGGAELSPNQAGSIGRDPAIDALAQTMAAKRGSTPVPRRSRVPAGERAHAVSLMIRLFWLGEQTDITAQDARWSRGC